MRKFIRPSLREHFTAYLGRLDISYDTESTEQVPDPITGFAAEEDYPQYYDLVYLNVAGIPKSRRPETEPHLLPVSSVSGNVNFPFVSETVAPPGSAPPPANI